MPADKPKVTINLDTFEREAPDPFSVVLGGKRYLFLDAMEIDYRVLIDALVGHMNGNSKALLTVILPDDKQEDFFANQLPVYKLQALMTAYMAHYGLDPGEAPASPPSSDGTAGQSRQTLRSVAST